jgi:hypothetical protein
LSKDREAKELTPAADGATQLWLILEAELCVVIGTVIGSSDFSIYAKKLHMIYVLMPFI